jgi:predicted DNA-binding transcriptional regulator AlpA
MRCSPLKVSRRFRETFRHHLHDRRVIQARNEHEAGSKKSFAWGHMFPPKRRLTFNGLHGMTSQKTELFPRNVGWLSTDCKAWRPRRQNSSRETSVDFQQTTWYDIPEDRTLPPKRRLTFNGLHDMTSQKTELFPRNVGWLSTDYIARHPRRQNSSLQL